MRAIIKCSAVGLGLVLGVCAGPQEQNGSLAVSGCTAIIESTFTFAQRDRLAGRHAEAARAEDPPARVHDAVLPMADVKCPRPPCRARLSDGSDMSAAEECVLMMPHPQLGATLLALSLAACAGLQPTAELPPDPAYSTIAPDDAALSIVALAFSQPDGPARGAAEHAFTVALAERVVVALRTNQRYTSFSPIAQLQYERARPEWRAAFGIAPMAPPQAVIDQLFAARRALRAGDRAAAAGALTAPTFIDGGEAALTRLAALPPLPNTARAAALAQRELYDMGRERVGDR